MERREAPVRWLPGLGGRSDISRRRLKMMRINGVTYRPAIWFTAHRELPRLLGVWVVVPATVALVVVGGLGLTLHPGPLCDEGMVLFMEGGCDWGVSNEFFFSKLGLLLAMNLVFIVSWVRGVQGARGFLPHFIVLALLTLANYSDEYCRHYYSHPNGSIGQMTTEAIAFGLLGVTILSCIRVRTLLRLGIVVLAGTVCISAPSISRFSSLITGRGCTHL